MLIVSSDQTEGAQWFKITFHTCSKMPSDINIKDDKKTAYITSIG